MCRYCTDLTSICPTDLAYAHGLVECPRCGQLREISGVCEWCRKADREPQGEAVKLFEPAPTQIPGQLAF